MSHAPQFIDITLPLSPSTPVWPGDVPVSIRRSFGMAVVSDLSMSSHAGTHVDAPAHFFPQDGTVDRIALDTLIGSAWVARFPGVTIVTGDALEHAGVPRAIDRLLIATDNAATQGAEFNRDFVALDETAIDWLLNRHIRLVGIDAPSIDPFSSKDFYGHKTLLSAGVVIIENLALAHVRPGAYRLICLPLRYEGGDGAPARVALERI